MLEQKLPSLTEPFYVIGYIVAAIRSSLVCEEVLDFWELWRDRGYFSGQSNKFLPDLCWGQVCDGTIEEFILALHELTHGEKGIQEYLIERMIESNKM